MKKEVEGWEEYQVDTEGNIYSKSGKILKYSINHNGYCIVNFIKNGKRKGFAVHTIVAKTFIENKNKEKTQVNHKNGIKTDNRVENLEWVTPKENVRHAIDVLGFNQNGKNSALAKKVQAFDVKTNEIKYEFESLSDAARFFAGDDKNYRNICKLISNVIHKNGKKTYKGCRWEYK